MLQRPRTTDLTNYDPEKGLKTIAVAEAAERHYARAKDASKLQAAIRTKLEAQADFVVWWDAQSKDRGGRPAKTRRRSATGFQNPGRNGLPDRYVIDRWRRKLVDPARFEATFAAALARYVRILELETIAHVGQNSGENEWYTPALLVEAARDVLGGIDLDPASSAAANEVIQAAHMFTSETDGRAQEWTGRVWMNPPYAQPLITEFCAKFAASVRAGTVTAAVVLVNNATETEWFQTLAGVAAAICFPLGRVRFWSPGKEAAAPLQGQAVLYTGADVSLFCERFVSFGLVATLVRAVHDATAERSRKHFELV